MKDEGAARDNPLRALLASGGRKETGGSSAAARAILDHPPLLGEAIACLRSGDPAVVAHAAHALMQVSRDRPELLRPHVGTLCGFLEGQPQREIGEQLPKIITAVDLTAAQAKRAAALFADQVSRSPATAAASALTGLVWLARKGLIDRRLCDEIVAAALASPRKALAARARKLAGG